MEFSYNDNKYNLPNTDKMSIDLLGDVLGDFSNKTSTSLEWLYVGNNNEFNGLEYFDEFTIEAIFEIIENDEDVELDDVEFQIKEDKLYIYSGDVVHIFLPLNYISDKIYKKLYDYLEIEDTDFKIEQIKNNVFQFLGLESGKEIDFDEFNKYNKKIVNKFSRIGIKNMYEDFKLKGDEKDDRR